MHIIPLKKKFQLTEEDINNLSAWIIEGRSLEEICFHFEGKMNIEQIFMAANVIAREMYDMSLQELCPELISERKELNQERYDLWKSMKKDQGLMSLLKDTMDDLSLYEMELQVAVSRL